MKLKVLTNILTDNQLMALWVVLDVDESNQLLMDEFSAFLRGRPKALASAQAVARVQRAVTPTRLSPEMREIARRRAEIEAEKPWRAERHLQLSLDAQERYAKETDRREALESARERRRSYEFLNTQYKRALLGQMRTTMIKSPIPAEQRRTSAGVRIGSNRFIPLYETERLLRELEGRNPGLDQKRQPTWPGSKPWAPRSPSTFLLEQVSRKEPDLMSPSWHGRSKDSPPSSRPPSPPPDVGFSPRRYGPTDFGARPARRAEPKVPAALSPSVTAPRSMSRSGSLPAMSHRKHAGDGGASSAAPGTPLPSSRFPASFVYFGEGNPVSASGAALGSESSAARSASWSSNAKSSKR